MIPNVITDEDMIILDSVDSYLKKRGVPMTQDPQEKLVMYQKTRDYLYSDIVRRTPRAALYILTANMETDDRAKGLFIALYNHAMSPVFVNILMQYLSIAQSPEECGSTAALLVKIMNKYIDQNWKEPEKPKKGEKPEKTETPKNDMENIAHIQKAVNFLLGDLTNRVSVKCCNLTQPESQAIAAAIAMNNTDTIRQIILSDLPVTADILELIDVPNNVIRSALLLEKSEFVKLTSNQDKFVESLKRWVYKMLDSLPGCEAYKYLIDVYHSSRPDDLSKYLIQIRDCSKNQYPNLHRTAEELVGK